MSNDISESGKGWIPAPQADKHFKLGDVVFMSSGGPGAGVMEVVQITREVMSFCRHLPGTYLKLATVAWPEWPYTKEDMPQKKAKKPKLKKAKLKEDGFEIPCMNCGKLHWFSVNSNEAKGIFNVFCDGECEDRYAAKL